MTSQTIFPRISKIRADFPILKRRIHGKPMVYFDNAATSQKPRVVIDAIQEFYTHHYANVHRAIHTLGEEATERFESVREKACTFIDSRNSEEIIFTRGTTESLNLVAYSWARRNIRRNDQIVLTEMEHHSNLVPWQLLAKHRKARLEFIRIDDGGHLVLSDLDRLLTKNTRLLSATYVSNVLGTINPVKELVKRARENGTVTVLDAAQATPHMPVDVRDIGCDFFAFSAHKMLGPTGVGVLYGRRELLEEMDPYQSGGEMLKEAHLRSAEWNDVPWKFEAGTSNVAGVIGFGAALGYLTGLGMDNVRKHELELTKYGLERISEVDGIVVYGPLDARERGGVISFNLGDIHAHDMATILDEEGICVRSGHHCAQPLMERLGVPATARASFYIYNTKDEIDRLIEALEKARKVFRL